MKAAEVKIAILDLYDNEPNQGMRCIQDIIASVDGEVNQTPLSYKIYDVRHKAEIPKAGDYDLYISTGGPGSPFEGVGKTWEKQYFRLIDDLWEHNERNTEHKKHVFFICHSFQMMCRFFNLARVQERSARSFGIIPVQRTEEGQLDLLTRELPETYYAADFRQFEVVAPNPEMMDELDAKILSREKIRKDMSKELALMAIRVSPEMIGTQYHPEADPVSMLYHFRQPERKEQVLNEYGEDKYDEMIEHLEDPTNILLTRSKILPVFLRNAIAQLRPEMLVDTLV